MTTNSHGRSSGSGFASDASHDLRSPLTAIRTQVEETLLHPEETDWPATGKVLLDGVERLQNLIIDLLQIARLDAGISGWHEFIQKGLTSGHPRKLSVLAVTIDGNSPTSPPEAADGTTTYAGSTKITP